MNCCYCNVKVFPLVYTINGYSYDETDNKYYVKDRNDYTIFYCPRCQNLLNGKDFENEKEEKKAP